MINRKRKISLLLSVVVVIAMFIAFTTTAYAEASFPRIGGADRYATAVEVSKRGWSGSSDTAVLATGVDFPDALTAAPLAKKFNAPILLTERDSIPQVVINELVRLKVKTVYIVGGTGVVSSNVESQLISMSIASIRLAGADRFDTAVKVAEIVGIHNGEIAVANGYEFAEALSVSPIAAGKGMPILLVETTSVPDCVSRYLEGKGITKSYLLGGENLISGSIAYKFPNPDRITGNNKYERNVNIIRKFENSINFANIYLATGRDFPDALAVSAMASKTSSPIVLVDDQDIKGATKVFLMNRLQGVSSLNVIGLQGAVDDWSVGILSSGELDSEVEYTVDDLNNMELSLIAENYVLLIELGIPGSEPVLIRALDRYGDAEMAVHFLNCGNYQLDQAARSWATAHGYEVYTVPGGVSGPVWGEM